MNFSCPKDYIKRNNDSCSLLCHKECDTCYQANDNTKCQKCKHLEGKNGSKTICLERCYGKRINESTKECVDCPENQFQDKFTGQETQCTGE